MNLSRAARQPGEVAAARGEAVPPGTEGLRCLLSPSGSISLAYLAAITVAEVVTALADTRLGLILHVVLLTALLLHAAFIASEAHRGLLLTLSLAPLIRILSLSMPLEEVDLKYWYAVVPAPLLVASIVVARTIRLSRHDLGLTPGFLPTQLLVAATGFLLGPVEYLILRPDPLIESFNWAAVWLPALILMVGTGFVEELVFRGMMQTTARRALGRPGIIYAAVVFAVLHIGYRSVLDMVFVFGVALFFAWVVVRTRSILGVTLSHGFTNISLFLIVPFL